MVPDIYWFIFWSLFMVALVAWGFWSGWNTHKVRMKTLEILRIYAEKGVEPPPSLMEQLSEELFSDRQKAKAAAKAAAKDQANLAAVYLAQFVGSLTGAGLAGAFAWWWLAEHKHPEWVGYLAGGFALMFAAGGLAQFLAAIVANRK